MANVNNIVSIVSVNGANKRGAGATSEGSKVLFARIRVSLLTRWRTWRERRNSRRALGRLTAEQLRDIGLTSSEARREYRKSLYVE